ncbi:MAG: hypothetical protein J5501_01335 [Ruminococcus sp.]|nr:hypothetical protein [Ruminococcus sp.]
MEASYYVERLIDTKPTPVVICDLDYRIVFMNSCAKQRRKLANGESLVGKSLHSFVDVETLTKIDMVVEWFKESKANNKVFSQHTDTNTDIYIIAIRDEDGELIGFTDIFEERDPDCGETYDLD